MKRGLTVIEVLLAAILLVLLLLVVFRIFGLQKLAWFTVEKLDTLQRLRVAEKRIRGVLELGTSILHPPFAPGQASRRYHRAVFTGPTNSLHCLYLTETGKLMLAEHGQAPLLLCEDVLELTVAHPVRGALSCEILASTEGRGTVSIAVSVAAGNTFHGEGSAP